MIIVLTAVIALVLATDATSATEESQAVGIQWDGSTLTWVANAGYARMIRTAKGDILCAADSGGAVWIKRSRDNGKTWVEPLQVAACEYGDATNPELLLLESGAILCCYNERPKDGTHPFAILTTLSRDNGKTWSVPERVYRADTEWDNGCWEPAAIQLPNKEIQLFFANENPYRSSGEQEITLLRSKNEGKRWSRPEKISFRASHRDGMPVPLVLSNRKHIVVAIEDSGFHGSLKPVIIHSKLSKNWRRGFVTGWSKDRWGALAKPLDKEVTAAAPYLRQMPSGETILSVQLTGPDRKQPHMVVYVGDSSARGFDHSSIPFKVPANVGCYWNSLFVKDADTVTAVAGTRLRGKKGIWAIDGRLIRPGKVKSR